MAAPEISALPPLTEVDRLPHRQHRAAQLADRSVEVLAQRLELRREPLVDLAHQVAGGQSLDPRRQRLGRLIEALLGFPLRFRLDVDALTLRAPALGFGRRLELAIADCRLAEHLDGARHLADFVAPLDVRRRDGGFTLGQRLHPSGDAADQFGDVAQRDNAQGEDGEYDRGGPGGVPDQAEADLGGPGLRLLVDQAGGLADQARRRLGARCGRSGPEVGNIGRQSGVGRILVEALAHHGDRLGLRPVLERVESSDDLRRQVLAEGRAVSVAQIQPMQQEGVVFVGQLLLGEVHLGEIDLDELSVVDLHEGVEAVDQTRQTQIADRRAGAASQIEARRRGALQHAERLLLGRRAGVDMGAIGLDPFLLLLDDRDVGVDRRIGGPARLPSVVGGKHAGKGGVSAVAPLRQLVGLGEGFARGGLGEGCAGVGQPLDRHRRIEGGVLAIIGPCRREAEQSERRQWNDGENQHQAADRDFRHGFPSGRRRGAKGAIRIACGAANLWQSVVN